MKRMYGFIGLVLIIFSFIYWFIPYRGIELIAFFHLCFITGNILFFDFLSYSFAKWSLLCGNKKLSLIMHFLLIGFIVGTCIEIYVHWIGRFWYFPLIKDPLEYAAILPFYGIYALYLLETFLGIKAVLERYFVKHKRRKKSFAGLKKIYLLIGALSTIGIGAVSVYVAIRATFGSTISQTFSILYAPFYANSPYYFFLLLAILFWLFFEYLEYERHETSIIYETIKGNFWPFIAVCISAWLSAFLYEIFNAPGKAWVYENYPFSNLTIMTIPIVVFITWPFHYLPIFSLYRLIFKKESEKIWE